MALDLLCPTRDTLLISKGRELWRRERERRVNITKAQELKPPNHVVLLKELYIPLKDIITQLVILFR